MQSERIYLVWAHPRHDSLTAHIADAIHQRAMGEEYKLDGVKPPKKETMERVKGILEQYGHKVMF